MTAHQAGLCELRSTSQLVDIRELVHEPCRGTPVAMQGPVYRVAVFGVSAERSTLIIAAQIGGYPIRFRLGSPPLSDPDMH